MLSLSLEALAQTSLPDTIKSPAMPTVREDVSVKEKNGPSAQYRSQVKQGDDAYEYYALADAIEPLPKGLGSR